MYRILSTILTVTLLLSLSSSIMIHAQTKVPENGKNETLQQRNERMKWWREARFGMFIHWGLYAVPAGIYQGKSISRDEHVSLLGEWIMATSDIPKETYEQYAGKFNPVAFDADEWVRIAQDAGMKYLVITSKHHDGFSMFSSNTSDYTIMKSTPYKKDPIQALSEACKKTGIKLCFYYSILDWHHPAQVLNEKAKPGRKYAEALIRDGRKKEYVSYMKTQLRELMEKYDPAVLWFDGEWVPWWTKEDGRDLARYLWDMNPNLIINNRVGKRDPDDGDFGTPEQHIPDQGLDYDWETCMTINDTWGYRIDDHRWKSTGVLLQNLVDIASKGGNFLLNVGPTKEGIIPAPSIDRLKKMGAWMKVNGESIYGTSASPFSHPDWGRYTRKPGRLYAHVFNWPIDQTLHIPAVEEKITKAYLLAYPAQKPLKVQQTKSGVTVKLPAAAPDTVDSVIVLELE